MTSKNCNSTRFMAEQIRKQPWETSNPPCSYQLYCKTNQETTQGNIQPPMFLPAILQNKSGNNPGKHPTPHVPTSFIANKSGNNPGKHPTLHVPTSFIAKQIRKQPVPIFLSDFNSYEIN